MQGRRWVIAAIAGTAVLAIGGTAVPPATAGEGVVVRKNAANLTQAERDRFLDALFELKRRPSPYGNAPYKLLGGAWSDSKPELKHLSWYDQLVAWHHRLYECEHRAFTSPDLTQPGMMRGHGGPMFLPWHRLYVRLLEQALQEVGGKDIAVPYWDWTYQKPDAQGRETDPVLNDDFMGGDGDPERGYTLTGSRFAPPDDPKAPDFPLVVHAEGVAYRSSRSDYLTRRLGYFAKAISLPPMAEVVHTLTSAHYDAPPYNTRSKLGESFRNHLEGFRGDRPVPSTAPSPIRGMPFDTKLCGPDGFMFAWDGPWLHNLVHQWLGGTLEPPGRNPTEPDPAVFGSIMTPTSPNDPMFFLLHTNIDRIWASWQRLHPKQKQYRPEEGQAYEKNLLNDTMFPFNQVSLDEHPELHKTPADVEDTRELGYVYDELLKAPKPARATAAGAPAAATAAGAPAAATVSTSGPARLSDAQRRMLWRVCRLQAERRAGR